MSDYPFSFAKRLFDVGLAGSALLAGAPAYLAIAALVRLEDGGPALSAQTRVGRGRAPFTLLKFRTVNERGVTRVGRWLRETGLDEIPQALNVLRGDMSLVGPRPLAPEDAARPRRDAAEFDARWALAPGVTGLAQLLGRGGTRADGRLERVYLRRASLELDAQLVGLSFAAKLLGRRKLRRWLGKDAPAAAR